MATDVNGSRPHRYRMIGPGSPYALEIGDHPQRGACVGTPTGPRWPRPGRLAPHVDYAEQISVGVGKDHEIFTLLAEPEKARPEAKQPFDLSLRVVRVQIEMQSVSVGLHSIEGHIGPLSRWVLQDHERVVGRKWPSWSVPERLLPKGQHPIEVFDVNHDGPDSHRCVPHAAEHPRIRL